MFSESELEALELMVKAGKIIPNATWKEAIPQVKEYIVGLAARLMKEQAPPPIITGDPERVKQVQAGRGSVVHLPDEDGITRIPDFSMPLQSR